MKTLFSSLALAFFTFAALSQTQYFGSFNGNGGPTASGGGLTNTPTWFQGPNFEQVDPRGNDSTASRNGAPFLTLTDAMAVAQAGDTVILPPGTNFYDYANLTIPLGVNLVGRGQDVTFIKLANNFLAGSNSLSDFSMSGVWPGGNTYSNIVLNHVTIDNFHTNYVWVNPETDCFYNGDYENCRIVGGYFYSFADAFYYFTSSEFDDDRIYCIDGTSPSHMASGGVNGDNDTFNNDFIYCTNALSFDSPACINDTGGVNNTMYIHNCVLVHDGTAAAVISTSGVANLGNWFDNSTNMTPDGPLYTQSPLMSPLYENTNSTDPGYMARISNSAAYCPIYPHITNSVVTWTSTP
jgi:hypothetical protein